MSDLDLSIALHDNARTRPVLSGEVRAEGIRFLPTRVHGSEMFWRQLRFGDFDISEMSLSSFLIALSRGDTRWVGLPVYTMRGFFHTGIMVRSDAGIRVPADLKGKRVGVPEYQQTSAVLQHEFGVHPSDVEWHMERVAEFSHGGATSFEPPVGVRIHQIPADTNIGELMLAGKLDATLLYLRDRNLVDRSRVDLSTSNVVQPLFPNRAAEAHRYFRKTGLFPINHAMVVRRSLLDRHPWIALNVYKAFVEAKASLATAAQAYLEPFSQIGTVDESAIAALRADPMAYGVKAARNVLDAICDYVFEQGLTARRIALEEVFAESTLDL
jgi:4,5-dihydroxyphthalate decarboxylase